MRIFNEAKTQELTEYDLSKGFLKDDTLTIHHEATNGVEEKGHYETIKEYENGGKDVKWVVDVKGIEAHPEFDEIENIQVYIPYTEKELNEMYATNRIQQLKRLLAETDYRAIKYAEGLYTEEEYAPYKQLRQSYRDEINKLEAELNAQE